MPVFNIIIKMNILRLILFLNILDVSFSCATTSDCVTSNGVCFECSVSNACITVVDCCIDGNDCLSTQHCETSTHKCVKTIIDYTCTYTEDCSDGFICKEGMCVQGSDNTTNKSAFYMLAIGTPIIIIVLAAVMAVLLARFCCCKDRFINDHKTTKERLGIILQGAAPPINTIPVAMMPGQMVNGVVIGAPMIIKTPPAPDLGR